MRAYRTEASVVELILVSINIRRLQVCTLETMLINHTNHILQ